jgi:hypothetical protein
MKALIYRPGQPSTVDEVADFKAIQKLCGGYIERVFLEFGPGSRRWIELWCNEDGIGLGLTPNLWAEGPAYEGAPILGVAVLCAGRNTKDDQESLSLTDDEVARWRNAFKRARPGLKAEDLF